MFLRLSQWAGAFTHEKQYYSSDLVENYYKLFDLPLNATKAQITNRFHQLAKKYHPDRKNYPKDVAHNKFIELNDGYGCLLNYNEAMNIEKIRAAYCKMQKQKQRTAEHEKTRRLIQQKEKEKQIQIAALKKKLLDDDLNSMSPVKLDKSIYKKYKKMKDKLNEKRNRNKTNMVCNTAVSNENAAVKMCTINERNQCKVHQKHKSKKKLMSNNCSYIVKF